MRFTVWMAACRLRSCRPKTHDFGDLWRALEMVALLPGVALGGQGADAQAVNGWYSHKDGETAPDRLEPFGSIFPLR